VRILLLAVSFSRIGHNGGAIDTYCFPRFNAGRGWWEGRHWECRYVSFPGELLILIEDLFSIPDMNHLLGGLNVECYKTYKIPISQTGISFVSSAEEWFVYIAIIEMFA
jgi:hypothetical protein